MERKIDLANEHIHIHTCQKKNHKTKKLTREVQSVQVLAEARETKVEIKIQAFIVRKKDGRL